MSEGCAPCGMWDVAGGLPVLWGGACAWSSASGMRALAADCWLRFGLGPVHAVAACVRVLPAYGFGCQIFE